MLLDYESKVFKCMYHLDPEEIMYTSQGRAVSTNQVSCHHYENHRRREWMESCERFAAKPRVTTFPVVLHFNGPKKEKEMRKTIAQRLLWPANVTQAEIWSEMVLDVDYAQLHRLGNMCEDYTPQMACGSSVGECLGRNS
mmetsp:Transcript_44814/g.70178  ORF Transcript_44814/g.70178 Transcript_44814/m.70178 type:complete len:140 (-) Transcript_44814:681-1100(-)